jgi:hypothetical protein
MAAFIFVAPVRAAVDGLSCADVDGDNIACTALTDGGENCYFYTDGERGDFYAEPCSFGVGDFGTSCSFIASYVADPDGVYEISIRTGSSYGDADGNPDIASGTYDCSDGSWIGSGGGGGGSFMFSADDANTAFFEIQDALKTFLLIAIPSILGGLVILRWIFRLYGKVRKGR